MSNKGQVFPLCSCRSALKVICIFKTVGLSNAGAVKTESFELILVVVFNLLASFNSCCLYVIVGKVLIAEYNLRPKRLKVMEP